MTADVYTLLMQERKKLRRLQRRRAILATALREIQALQLGWRRGDAARLAENALKACRLPLASTDNKFKRIVDSGKP